MPNGSKLKVIVRGCSHLLTWAGGAAFLVGGKFLYEIKHVNFAKAEAEGILGGTLLMFLGFGLGLVGETSSPKQ